ILDDFKNLPNLHINFYLLQNCKNYATLVNTNCAIKEMVHRLSKQAVLKTNRKNVELDLIRCTNVLQAIRYLMDGGADDRFNESNVGDGLRCIITDQRLQPLLAGWYITDDLYPENISNEETGIVSEDSRIVNIWVRQQLTNVEIRASQLTSNLDENTYLKNGLFAAYSEYMKQHDDGGFYAHIKLHIGDIVIIKEETDESYAIVRAIFTHKYNDGNVYAFVWIDWLKKTKCTDSLLRCPIFEQQPDLDTK
ncbi:11585_t:CDS:2, partial [Racocetra persica]